jgi:membrane protein YqaA with SNARE-associated domain
MPAPTTLALSQADILWIAVVFGLAVASAVLPWVNAELLLLAVAAPLTSTTALLIAVLAVTVGQVSGKSALYWLARCARLRMPARLNPTISRWRRRQEQQPAAALAMMLVSATVGMPPFYLTTLAAGVLRIAFGTFLAAALLGRLLHFAVIATVPGLVGGWLR